ncbi:MAG TPA: alpha/beta hydrolase [Gemmatimonadaceae bacterium]|nr:alpha/beta hydrolase [Gemmatimonadaceae bacterium]
MEVVNSRDGTPIAFWRSGTGPPLVLVHGATADHTTTWRSVLSPLEREFTVYAMDRRGRGGSGDSSAYALAREADDVVAVLNAIDAPAYVLGHSFGGLCALEAALRTTRMARMVLYEGVALRGADAYAPGVIDRLRDMMERGEVDGALVAMLRDVAGMAPEEIDVVRSQATAWQRRIANARTIPRELQADATYVFEPRRFAAMMTPTMLLVGEKSLPRELDNAQGVAAALPNARVVVLPGQQHVAMHTAPDLFVREVVSFFLE